MSKAEHKLLEWIPLVKSMRQEITLSTAVLQSVATTVSDTWKSTGQTLAKAGKTHRRRDDGEKIRLSSLGWNENFLSEAPRQNELESYLQKSLILSRFGLIWTTLIPHLISPHLKSTRTLQICPADLPENCYLNVKKLPKLAFFFKKWPKNCPFSQTWHC